MTEESFEDTDEIVTERGEETSAEPAKIAERIPQREPEPEQVSIATFE